MDNHIILEYRKLDALVPALPGEQWTICNSFFLAAYLRLLSFMIHNNCVWYPWSTRFKFGNHDKQYVCLVFMTYIFLLLLLLWKPAAQAPGAKRKLFINFFRNPIITCATENWRKHNSGKQPMVDCILKLIQRSGTCPAFQRSPYPAFRYTYYTVRVAV